MLYLINCMLLVSAVLVSHTASPVNSVIFLILAFCCASLILFMFNAEFIALIFIIIYVGAIAVLFLFVIMMLDIKDHSEEWENKIGNSIFHDIFFCCTFAVCLYLSFCFVFYLGFDFFPLKYSLLKHEHILHGISCGLSDLFIEKSLLENGSLSGLDISGLPWLSTPDFSIQSWVLVYGQGQPSVDFEVPTFWVSFTIRELESLTPHYYQTLEAVNYLSLIDDLNNIDLIGQMLYNEQLINFLIAGLILLIALIGSIILTFQFNTSTEKHQNVNRQLARTDNFVSFFK